MDMKDTLALMGSEDFKERFKAEYWQTKNRCNGLHNMIVKYAANTLPFRANCSIELLKEQEKAMLRYLFILEVRAEIEKVNLKEESLKRSDS